jgi:hypothetical protein
MPSIFAVLLDTVKQFENGCKPLASGWKPIKPEPMSSRQKTAEIFFVTRFIGDLQNAARQNVHLQIVTITY